MGKTDKLGPLLREELERTEGDPRVIVRLRPDVAVSQQTVSLLSNTGAEVVERNPDLGFVVANALPDQIDDIQELGAVEQVELDAEVSIQQRQDSPFTTASNSPITALDANAAATQRSISEVKGSIDANTVNDNGVTGSGATVAVLDTGVRSDHPALEGQVVDAINLAGGEVEDALGHGTWVASAIAGNGTNIAGRVLEGIAPDADILNIKVLGDDGTGRISTVLEGINQAGKSGADVVCMSLGIPTSGGRDSTICDIVDEVSEVDDVIVAAAAGNRGPTTSPHLPAACERAIATGSVNDNGNVSRFSSRGPITGDIVYPDVAAPGGGSNDGIIGAAPPATVTSLKGTSMATPYVAGLAALARASNPGASSQTVRNAIEQSASQPNNPDNQIGKGIIDAQTTIEQLETTQPPETTDSTTAKAVTTAAIAGGLALDAEELLLAEEAIL
jgi:subtilisin family serine protease